MSSTGRLSFAETFSDRSMTLDHPHVPDASSPQLSRSLKARIGRLSQYADRNHQVFFEHRALLDEQRDWVTDKLSAGAGVVGETPSDYDLDFRGRHGGACAVTPCAVGVPGPSVDFRATHLYGSPSFMPKGPRWSAETRVPDQGPVSPIAQTPKAERRRETLFRNASAPVCPAVRRAPVNPGFDASLSGLRWRLAGAQTLAVQLPLPHWKGPAGSIEQHAERRWLPAS